MLDPIKFGIVCPGMKADGKLDTNGIPADIVTAYLGRHGIVPSRTTDHMVLFLFSMGVTKGKWGTLLNTLLDFKADYDRNAPLAEVVPAVFAEAPDRYAGMGLKDLGDEMWAHLRKSRQGHWQAQAYATLPKPEMTPRRAFQLLMSGDAEKVPLARMAGRVAAVGVIPYPPGIPIVMPGRKPRPGRRALAHVPAHAPGVRPPVPRLCKGSRGRRRARRRISRLLRQGKVRTSCATTQMIEYAARTPKIPIPFHKLFKVVALVDGGNPHVKALLDQIRAARTSRSRSATATTATSRKTRRSAPTSLPSTAPIASLRASSRKRYGTSDSGRRSGRWRIRAGLPTRPCSEWPARSTASYTSGSRRRLSTRSRSLQASRPTA